MCLLSLSVGPEVTVVFVLIISFIAMEGFDSPNESKSCFEGQFDPAVDSRGKLVPDEGSDSSK